MITSAAQLEQWQKWIEEGDITVALRAMQALIDGQDLAGPDFVAAAREQYASGSNEYNVQIDDDADTSGADNGTWVQAWVWLDGFITEEHCG